MDTRPIILRKVGAVNAKYQYKFSDKIVLTALTGIVDLASSLKTIVSRILAAQTFSLL